MRLYSKLFRGFCNLTLWTHAREIENISTQVWSNKMSLYIRDKLVKTRMSC